MVWDTARSEATKLAGQVPGVRNRIRGPQQDTGQSAPVGRLVTAFAKLAGRFRDLDFADRGGTLELRRDLWSVIRVRVELPKSEALRLATVLVDAEEVTDLSQQVTLTASSILAEYRPAWDQRLLFDPGNTATAVHTKKQQRPWLEIAFDRPVHVTRIFLRNADTADSAAVRGIQVLACRADRGWETVYDAWRRERAFARAVEEQCSPRPHSRMHSWTHLGTRRRPFLGSHLLGSHLLGSHRRWPDAGGARMNGEQGTRVEETTERSGLSTDSIADLTKILTQIHLRDYATARGDLDRAALTASQTAEFKSLVNERLAEREVEWSSHGIKRTFRFWSQQEKQDYLAFTVDVVRCLQDLNDNVCLGFGTVLGLIRDHDLIAHDDDADVIIGFEPSQAATLGQGRELISECLQDHGYRVTKNRIAHHWVTPPDGGVKLDAFAGIFEGDSISWYPGKRGVLTRQMVFPAISIERLGQTCPIPREPERYLEQIYGDWRTPDPYFHHRYQDVRPGYDDLRGPVDSPAETAS